MTHLEEALNEAAAAAAAAAEEALNETTAEVEDETPQTIEEQYTSALGKAIAYWQADRYIPLTLATELMADGYDVGVLEARYLKA